MAAIPLDLFLQFLGGNDLIIDNDFRSFALVQSPNNFLCDFYPFALLAVLFETPPGQSAFILCFPNASQQ
jgi:hypothetical protein